MSTVPFPPKMGYQPGMGPLHPARSPGAGPQLSARSAQKRSEGQQQASEGDNDQGKVPDGSDEA